MEENKISSDILGKKVFFLYPTGSIQNQIVTELIQQEIEAYTCKDYKRLSKLLNKYPDSIIYANIDDGMPAQEWERWISGTMQMMKDVKFGIFTSSSDESVRERYISNIKVACGFFALKVDMSRTVPIIIEILNKLNVKGRRKYLRISPEKENPAAINIGLHGDYINGTIRDISTVGFSCVFDLDPGYKKNELIKDIQIRLQSMLLRVEGVVFGCREENGQNIYVVLFNKRIDPEFRVKIHKYIQQNLQRKMDMEMK